MTPAPIDSPFAIPNGTQLVVCDLDGTLYNKHGLPLRLIWACRCSLSLLKAERKARKQLKGIYCGTQEDFYSRLFASIANACSVTRQQACDWYREVYMPAMVRTLQKHYRADALLLTQLYLWREQGIRLVVYSDYGETLAKLHAIGIDPSLFDAVFDAPSLGGLKPAKQGLEAILNRFHTASCNAVMIGDRPDTDGALAKNAGVQYIQYKAR